MSVIGFSEGHGVLPVLKASLFDERPSQEEAGMMGADTPAGST